MQTEVWNEVYATWQREEGQHWRALIHEDHREITLYLLKQKLKQYFKTHCFYTYGGDWWFRFLIAVGSVPEAAVRAINTVNAYRTSHRESRATSEDPQPATSWSFSSRQVRASTPDPARWVRPKKLRKHWLRLKQQLKEELRSYPNWMQDDNRDRILALEDKVKAAADAADNVSLASGFPHRDTKGNWRNVPDLYGRSIFEEALRMFLMSIGLKETQVDHLTRTEEPAAASCVIGIAGNCDHRAAGRVRVVRPPHAPAPEHSVRPRSQGLRP